MEISVFTFLCYPGTLMYLCILVLLYVFTLVYKINQIKHILYNKEIFQIIDLATTPKTGLS